jgi:hypothetical protein
MDETIRKDIRALLKTFGIQADEAISAYLADAPGEQPLHLRITLEDLTAYGGSPPEKDLRVEVEGQIRR